MSFFLDQDTIPSTGFYIPLWGGMGTATAGIQGDVEFRIAATEEGDAVWLIEGEKFPHTGHANGRWRRKTNLP